MVSSLTNGTEYTFQIVADDTTSASSAPAVYRTIAPGFKPSGALSTVATAVGSGRVAVTWAPPTSDGNAPIGWYVVRSVSSSPSDPIIKVSAYPTDSTATISSLNTASMYSFNVYAVNGPGYSPAVSTLSISPNISIGDIFTYIEVYEPDGGSNYAYRIYNSETDSWNMVESPYTVNDVDGEYSSSNFRYDGNTEGTSNTFSCGYNSEYDNPITDYGEYRFEFRNTNGSLLRTISTFNNNDGSYLPRSYGNSNTGFFYNSNDVTSNYDIQIYQPHTNTYQTSSITNTDNNINDINLLNNGVYFVTSNVDHYEHYVWNINSNTPTLITSNYTYDEEILYNPSTAMIVLGRVNDSSYYDTVTYMDDTGFSSNYSLPSNTYTNSDFNQYGIQGNYVYFRGYNSNTSNYDLYVFNQLPTMTPIILSNLGSNGYELEYEGNYDGPVNFDQTYASDSILVLNTEGTANRINAGGGMVEYGYTNLFYNDGNYINLTITLDDSSVPVNISNEYYGLSRMTSNYGYLVGSLNAKPHTTLMYTTAGSNDINVTGQYNILYGNVELYSTFTGSYTCANGNQGTYWVRQTGTSNPNSDPQPFGVDLWYSVENSNWGSAIDSSVQNYNNGGASYTYNNSVYGSNFILCKSLIGSISSIDSQWEGTFIDDATIVAFLQSYVNDAPFCDDPSNFSTINLVAFDEWNVSTGYVYYSTLLTTNFPYIYDGQTDYVPLRKGTAYLVSGSNTTVVSTIFTGSNLLAEYWTEINSNGAGFLVQEKDYVTAHILTSNGETSTILSTLDTFNSNYVDNYTDSDGFSDLFYFNIISPNNPDSFLYILSNDGTLLTSISSYVNLNSNFSGRNALIYNNYTSNVNIIQNGVFTSTIYLPYGYDDRDDPFPDFGNGDLAITSYDNDSNTIIVTITNDAISTFSTSFFTNYTNTFLTQSFLTMFQEIPFQLLIRDMNTGAQYGYSTISNANNVNILNQADSICFRAYSNSDMNDYIVFNFSTTTFSIQSDTSGDIEQDSFTTSPYSD
jgi:hypothetical protein